MDLIRAFIAITLPEELTGRLSDVQDELKRAVKSLPSDTGRNRNRGRGRPVSWTRPSGIHLTIKFLGEIDPARVGAISEALERAANGVHPFTLTAGGGGDAEGAEGAGGTEANAWVGGFPQLLNPRVVFTPLGESTVLAGLHENIERELDAIGIERDNRTFHPHLTLARVKSSEAGRAIGEAARRVDAGEPLSFTVKSFSLIRSVLGPGGAVYTPLKTIGLTQG